MRTSLYASAAVLALAAASAQAQDLPFAIGEGDFAWDSYNDFADQYDLSGETVEITGPWTGNEKEKVDAVFAYFAEATGASVNYSGSDSFEQDIVISTRAGTAPNLAVFPQPGLAADMASQGLLTPLADGTSEWVAENFAAGESWVDLGTYAGPDGEEDLYGLFYRVDVKSLVWYNPIAFDEAGYDIPETMEELKEPPRKSSTTAARRGASVSAPALRRAGRRPIGSKTSCSARKTPRSTISGSRTRSPSTIR